MPSYTTPVIIGTSQDFGNSSSLVTEAAHGIPGSSSVTAVRIQDGFYPEGEYAYCTALSIYSDTGTYRPWELVSIHITSNVQSPAYTYYGIKIDSPSVSSGTGNTQYGLYIANQNSAYTNYAIYTNAGSIRFGSLAGTGNRTVMVNSSGVLYA